MPLALLLFFFIIFAADVLLAVLYIGAFGYDKQDTATTTTTPIMCIEKNLKLLNMKDRESYSLCCRHFIDKSKREIKPVAFLPHQRGECMRMGESNVMLLGFLLSFLHNE